MPGTAAAGAILLSLLFAGPGPVAVPVPVPVPTEIVQLQVDAFNRGDAAAFAALYAHDIEIFDLGADSKPNLTGRAALLARYTPMLARYHPQVLILSRMASGTFVIDKERTTAGSQSSEGIAIYQVENGKIRRAWFTP